MSDAPLLPEIAALLSPDGKMVEKDIPCTNCNNSIKTLSVEGNCPECGCPVKYSLGLDAPPSLIPGAKRRIKTAAWSLAIAVFLLIPTSLYLPLPLLSALAFTVTYWNLVGWDRGRIAPVSMWYWRAAPVCLVLQICFYFFRPFQSAEFALCLLLLFPMTMWLKSLWEIRRIFMAFDLRLLSWFPLIPFLATGMLLIIAFSNALGSTQNHNSTIIVTPRDIHVIVGLLIFAALGGLGTLFSILGFLVLAFKIHSAGPKQDWTTKTST
jgi:hypothetical protein